MRELAPGSVVSGFRIDAVIGRGGMGIVYRAHELALGRSVALKVIAPELLDDDSARERFLREARAAASIEHANVIPVLHAGDADGVPYLVMRFVDGDDVRTLVRGAGAAGGRPPASFGVVFRARDGHLLLASQRGRMRLATGTPPLRLVRAPEGAGVRADVAPARAYAGPFRTLVAEGTTHAGGIVATSRHRFTAAAIESRSSLSGRLPAGARAETLFPTWGRTARAAARLRDGRSVRLGRAPVALRRVVTIDVTGDRGAGYRIAPLARPAAATVALAPTRPQPAAPTPGPTVVVRFAGAGPAPAFGARITVRG